MKTVIFTFGGEAVNGDLVIVTAESSRGGASSAKCVIGDPSKPDIHIPGTNIGRNFARAATIGDVATVLADQINGATSEWSTGAGDFKAQAKGNRLVVLASNLVNDVDFHCYFEGSMEETCDLEVIG